MRIVFLDIDGVLNDCSSKGVFDDSSTDEFCIAVLNEVIRRTNSKIIIISSWKDNFDLEIIVELLYNRGILLDSIIGATEKDVHKEIGIKNFLTKNNVEKYVILDDSIELQDQALKNFCVRTASHIGLMPEHMDQIIKILQPNNLIPSDSEMLDWLQGIMTNDEDYCEVFLAGLRDFNTGKASKFQIESNPEKFPTLNANSLREAIAQAMKLYKQ